jgi:hypothetical protein
MELATILIEPHTEFQHRIHQKFFGRFSGAHTQSQLYIVSPGGKDNLIASKRSRFNFLYSTMFAGPPHAAENKRRTTPVELRHHTSRTSYAGIHG